MNQVCRRLEEAGLLQRYTGPDGKIVNSRTDLSLTDDPVGHNRRRSTSATDTDENSLLTEDEVKEAVRLFLESHGFEVEVAWGRRRGVDIHATSGGRRILLKAKGEVVSQPQQTNYFLGALGELVQRMSDADATYGLALPDNRVFRGLADRLPDFARQHLGLRFFWVRRESGEVTLEVEPEQW